MKGPVYFASQPGFLQVGMENEGWAFKFSVSAFKKAVNLRV
jgi:hypothetical protein